MDFRKNISVRYFSIVLLMVLVALSIIARAAYIMFVEREYWKQVASRLVNENEEVKPERGNILSADGRLMASSLPEYKIFMDFMSGEKDPARKKKDQHRRDTLLTKHLTEICEGLHRVFPDKSAEEFRAHIKKGRAGEKRYWQLYPKRISYIQYKEVKKIPLFRDGKVGFIGEPFYRRKKPFGSLAMRTLGDMFVGYPDSAKNGLELAYDSILKGEVGITRRQKVRAKFLNVVEKAPVAGCDIVSTIDVNMQDIAEKALVDKLKELNASMGVALLMEVKTGEIKAIVNMTRAGDGNYYEMQNHAVSALMEPGSTFKTASFMVALDDGVIDTSTVVDTGNGVYNMHGSKMKDHNWHRGGYQQLTVTEALMVSSNIGVSRLIDEHYKNNPGKFVDGLYRIGMAAPLKLPFKGSATARIRHPKDGNWWKTTLPWMSIGYETQIPPINTLAFYNAIANDGALVNPKFVKAIVRDGKVIKEIPTEVLIPQICSPEALGKVRGMLEAVVSRGLGKQAGSRQFHVSGKTGTAQISKGAAGYKSGPMEYLVSFCGYFPSEAPRYTCLVAIRKPGYPASGGGMAGPVFSRIAERVMARSLKRDLAEIIDTGKVAVPNVMDGHLLETYSVLQTLGMDESVAEEAAEMLEESVRENELYAHIHTEENELNWKTGEMSDEVVPDVRGMGAKDAVFLMESRGLKVRINGTGRVVSQNIPAGRKVVKGETVNLNLKNNANR